MDMIWLAARTNKRNHKRFVLWQRNVNGYHYQIDIIRNGYSKPYCTIFDSYEVALAEFYRLVN